MHTVKKYKLSKTKQVCQCGKQFRTAMPLIIIKWKKLCRTSEQNLCRINENGAQNLQVIHTELAFFGAEFSQDVSCIIQ